MNRIVIASPNAPAPVGPYSQGVVMDGWLWTSGQVARTRTPALWLG